MSVMGATSETPLDLRKELQNWAAFSRRSEAESAEALGHKTQVGSPALGRTFRYRASICTRLLKDGPDVPTATVTQLTKNCALQDQHL